MATSVLLPEGAQEHGQGWHWLRDSPGLGRDSPRACQGQGRSHKASRAQGKAAQRLTRGLALLLLRFDPTGAKGKNGH